MESAITHEDKVITAYRCHPFAVLRGGTIHNVLAELLGESPCLTSKLSGTDDLLQARRLVLPRERVDRCTCSQSASTEVTVLSVPRFPSELVSPSPKSTRTRRRSPSRCTETVLPTRVRCSRLTTWQVENRMGDGSNLLTRILQAKLWNLPVVFVCENNKYGMGTSAERSSQNTNFFTRGDQIPGVQVSRPAKPCIHQC